MVDDADLIRAAATGDIGAFTTLIERHRRSALRVAYAIADGEAEEVTHDAAAKALRGLQRFRAEGQFRPWYLAIVANEARNRRRSYLRRSNLVLKVRAQPATAVDDPADVAAVNARREVLVSALARLALRDREVIAMRYFAELSEAEMASALSCAPGTVKSRLSRALSRLRVELGEVAP